MTHYVYKISYNNGMHYIGARSCKCLAIEDTKYQGSSKVIPNSIKCTGSKVILKEFSSREEAISYECDLHSEHNVALNPLYYNQVKQTSSKFDQQGCTADTHKHVASMAHKLRGRTAESHEYIAKANTKRKQYVGDNRTEAQKLGAIKVGDWNRGRKNPLKACKGSSNGGFNPWYYITPDGEYIEVHTVTKQDFAQTLGATARQLGHRFHYTNEHKRAGSRATKPLRGYTFGNIPKP